ncbi:2Fe-2S iron-sulfur cluster-binding protein [Xanthobacter sp. AM11]|uniref:2Fe-2S iron-sulfur cluster-binding protein n=1 Tax=Xanthobacter sp. AM11 TaxID=3380643 RepID=UPI0039BFB4CF
MTKDSEVTGQHVGHHGASVGGCLAGASGACPLAGLGGCSRGSPPGPQLPQSSTASRVTVTVEGHGSTSVSTQERVLVALERARGLGQLNGLPRRLPVGCRRGGCGVCRARVIAGDYRCAPMSREHVSAAEAADGAVLTCAIYAQSDLTLRFDSPALTGNRPTAGKTGANDQPARSGRKHEGESSHGPHRRS